MFRVCWVPSPTPSLVPFVWDIQCTRFFSTCDVRLPPPLRATDEVVINKHGSVAMLKKITYNEKVTNSKDLLQ